MSHPKFTVLACLLVAAAVTGSSYTFGVYSSALKEKYQFSQSQLDNISTLCFCSGFLTWLPGLVADRLGPSRTIFLGGSVQSTSFILFYLYSSSILPNSSDNTVNMLFLAGLLMTQFLGSGCVVAAVFATTVRTFPKHRGLVTGLIKGWVGLCGGMITQIFVGVVWGLDLDDQDDSAWLSFTLVAGVIVVFATLIPSRVLQNNSERVEVEGPEFDTQVRRRVKIGYVILVAMGVFVVSSALLEKYVPHYILSLFSFLIICVYVSPSLLAGEWVDSAFAKDRPSYAPLLKGEDDVLDNILDTEEGVVSLVSSVVLHPPTGSDYTIRTMVQTIDFYLLLYSLVVLIGSGIAVTTNSGQMFSSINSNMSAVSSTIFSATQSFSRVSCGVFCDVLRKKGSQRLWIVFVGLLVMMASYALFYVNTEISMVLGTAMSGLAFGSAWPTMVVVVSERFGVKNMGGNYMVFDGFASAVGTLVLGKLIPEQAYNSHLEQGETECTGKDCYEAAYGNIFVICLSAVVTSYIFISRANAHDKKHIDI